MKMATSYPFTIDGIATTPNDIAIGVLAAVGTTLLTMYAQPYIYSAIDKTEVFFSAEFEKLKKEYGFLKYY